MRRFVCVAGLATCAFTIAYPVWSSETSSYSYDALGRLVKISKNQTNGSVSRTQICYDAADNRTRYATTLTATAPSGCSGSTTSTSGGSTTSTSGGGGTPPSFAINNAAGVEGTTIAFTVTKLGSTTSSFSVNYATANGTATTNDYVAKSGTLVFGPSESSKTIQIALKTDLAIESYEYFYVNLSAPTGGATIATGQGTGTIEDDGSGGDPMCGGVPC